MITITINGKEIKLEKPVTVLEAARSVGIKIPTLCYHEQLERYGGCRLCLVEVEKIPRLQTACTLMATDGMVIRTETEQIADVRRGTLEFLLANHPLDCPYCDKAGECELQDLVEKYGPTTSRFKEKKRKIPESLEDPVIVRNTERCIMCTRCVRMCEGVQGASAIAVIDRGGHSHIEPFSGKKFNCEYCGNCISACPVGAIMSKLHRHSYRPWQLTKETKTICPYCGVGCTLFVQVRDDAIKRVVPKLGAGINNGLLCSRGKFGYEFVGSNERLSKPLIRIAPKGDTGKQGHGDVEKNLSHSPIHPFTDSPLFREATWEEALSLAAKKLEEIKNKYGSPAIAGIASPRCTNEDNYVFQKFMRATIGTNNIDSTARTGYAGAQKFIENIFGHGATANPIPEISNFDSILVIGGDPTAINPILGLQIRACSRKGGNILTIGRVNGLKYFNPIELKPSLFSEAVLLEGIVSSLKSKKTLSGSNQRLEAAIKGINTSIEETARICGVSGKDIAGFVDLLSESSRPAIVIGKETAQSIGGSYKLLLLSAITYLINGRIYLLSEQANEQGVLDIGCSPDFLPGYRITDNAGLSIFDMINPAKNTVIKAMYIMGENPVFNLPDSKKIESALKNIDFLVVQDIFLTETGKLADVVLPALSWSEKDGTFTNMERRIQRLRKAVNREGLEDWRIISEISTRMGTILDYPGAGAIFEEISRVSPLYKNMTYGEIEKGNAIYPYKGGQGKSVTEGIQINKGRAIDVKGKLYLALERPLFHSGTLSRKAPALVKIYPEAVLKISPETAAALSLKAGDIVRVSTKAGQLELPMAIDKELEKSLVLLTNNFENKGAFSLMEYTINPVTQAPCIEGNEVKVEKVKL